MRGFHRSVRPDKKYYKRWITKLSKATNLETSVIFWIFISFILIPAILVALNVFYDKFGSLASIITRLIFFLALSIFFFRKAYQGIIKKVVRVFPKERQYQMSESGYVGGKHSGIAKGKDAIFFGVIFLFVGILLVKPTWHYLVELLAIFIQ